MGNTIFLVATDPVCHFLSFQCFLSTLLHQGRLFGKGIIEKEPDLMEKSLRQMKVTAWWESNGTRLRVFNCVSVWKKSNSVATVASPTRPYRGCFHDRIFRSCPLLQHSPWTLPRGWTGRASTTPLKLVRFGHYPEMW
jgi:hypothetical protein